VPELIAKSALQGQKPLTLGGVTLAEEALGPITSIACYPDKAEAVGEVLGAFLAPNTRSANLLWTGPEQAFLLGTPPDLKGLAATTDQSGGWAALRLTGALDALLARLFPIDPRLLTQGACLRTPLGHMQAIVSRDEAGVLILVFRSMARTAWDEIAHALAMLEARARLEA
jgi:sarcosine oxidase subunit gamma